MKIGILTQPLHVNYGGLLQNYALQQVLIRAGHEVETIDWEPSNGLRSKLYRKKIWLLSYLAPNKYKRPGYRPTAKEVSIIRQHTNRFIHTYIRKTNKVYGKRGIAAQARKGRYDAFVVGSDQCWRPKYNSDCLPSMFLDFAVGRTDVKRIAYAASFGTDQWEYTPEMTAICSRLAKKFDFVSVREDSGVELCKQYLGFHAEHVLDPTLLLSKEDYIELIEQEKEPPSTGTLFTYILDPTAEKNQFIQRVADEMGLKPFRVLPKCQEETRTKANIKGQIGDCVYPSITSWLRAFMDAEMTIVDSFHGMVFSVIFNKPFWVIGNKKRGLSRFYSFLKFIKLDNRLLFDNDLSSADCKQSIDWLEVNDILINARSYCSGALLSYLKK